MNTNKCNDNFGCTYSKSMDQEYPRKCIKCGHPEESVLHGRNLKEFTIEDTAQLLKWIDMRNQYVRNLKYSKDETLFEIINQCNKNIKTILQLI